LNEHFRVGVHSARANGDVFQWISLHSGSGTPEFALEFSYMQIQPARHLNVMIIALAIALCFVFLTIWVHVAYAGPANRNAVNTGVQATVPINVNGFGAPLPGIA
jgi:hypothetical protein